MDRTTGRTKSLSDATVPGPTSDGYDRVLGDILGLLEQSRRTAAREVNALMTTTYWAIGRRIVDEEQGGRGRAAYGEALLKRLSADLTRRFGRGFSERNLEQMRLFYAAWPISQTPSAKSSPAHPALDISQTLSAKSPPFSLDTVAPPFPLPWSHYVRLLAVKNAEARHFYEVEALRGGWTVRQLDRQIGSQFYERTLLSRNKAATLKRGEAQKPEDAVTAEEEIKNPFVLEFLGLKDEYSEKRMRPWPTTLSKGCPAKFSPPNTARPCLTKRALPPRCKRPACCSIAEHEGLAASHSQPDLHSQRRWILGRDQGEVGVVAEFGQAARRCCDHCHSRGQRLSHHDRRAFAAAVGQGPAWMNEKVSRGHPVSQGCRAELAGKAKIHRARGSQSPQPRLLGPRACDHQGWP
jgi:hypothetical protein